MRVRGSFKALHALPITSRKAWWIAFLGGKLFWAAGFYGSGCESHPPSWNYSSLNPAVRPIRLPDRMINPFRIDFTRPQSTEELAIYVSMSPESFSRIVSSTSAEDFYVRHVIPKRSRHRTNETRVVWEAREWSVAVSHKAFARRFDIFARSRDLGYPHKAAYGYVRGRSTKANARVHCGAPLVLRADIRQFFPSIGVSRLFIEFERLGMSTAAATALAKFSTINEQLASGLNASPMLANLVCVSLDEKLEKLAASNGCVYTRYADDLTFSGSTDLPKRSDLEDVLMSEGFELSPRKYRVTKLGQAHYVTGLSVSDARGPHVPRSMKRRLRQELYYCRKFGVNEHLSRCHDETVQKGINRIDGTVRYVANHENLVGPKLKSAWDSICLLQRVAQSYATIAQPQRKVVCFVDESVFEVSDQKILALGLVFTDDPGMLREVTRSALRSHQVDPFAGGDWLALEKNGLHFTDAHPDLRTAYIKKLATLPYRAFVAYGELSSDVEYEQQYLKLLGRVIPQRLIFYDGVDLSFVFENNSSVSSEKIANVIQSAYSELEEKHNRRPAQMPAVSTGGKLEYSEFSVPDFLLAILGRYMQRSSYPKEKGRVEQFERVRDQYRLIIDADKQIEYSRRRPFDFI